ncbi:MAG TPA: MlaD family protein [Tepidisphaeraceae bacterium]|nr:MlaD family protein [Tepidisphaeraceae bacterium]
MAKQRNALTAGIFMLVSIAAAVYVIIAIAGTSSLFSHFRHYSAEFTLQDDIGGLRKGDDVRIGGLKVGTVTGIQFVRAGSRGAENPPVDSIDVGMDIPAEYPVDTDAKVGVQTTLTGVTSLNISDLGTAGPLVDGQYLHGTPDATAVFFRTLGQIAPKLADDVDQVGSTLQTYRSLGNDVHITLNQDVRPRLRAVSNSAVAALDSIHNMLGPSGGDFHAMMSNLRQITDTARQNAPALFAHADALLLKATATMDDLKETAANAKDVTGVLRGVVLRNQTRLDAIVIGLKRTSDNLEAASVEIRNAPWRLLYHPSPGEMGNLNLYDAARQFAEGANDVDDAASALRDCLRDKNADPKIVQKLYDNLQDRFQHFQQVEDDLWNRVKD